MTEPDQTFDTPPPDENGPTYRVAERPPLDPVSEAALRVWEALDKQLAALPDSGVAIVINPQPLAEAALAAVEGIPRVPRWTGDARTIGGRKLGATDDGPAQEAEIRLDVADGELLLTIESEDAERRPVTHVVHVDPIDAEGWLLAGLGACTAAREQTT